MSEDLAMLVGYGWVTDGLTGERVLERGTSKGLVSPLFRIKLVP